MSKIERQRKTMGSAKRQASIGAVLLAMIVAADGAVAHAQPVRFSFSQPERMFDQFFGEDADADREALRKISISRDDERRLGEQILEAGRAGWKAEGIEIVSKGRDVDYLKSIVATLQPFMANGERYPSIRVLVARSLRVDARSCPGGTLIFFEGLLDKAGSEAALAGIVGHELSHLDRGHQLLPLKKMKLMEETFVKGFDPAEFFQSGPAMIKLMSRPFRPEDERDADRDGAEWAFRAGYDIRELAKLFQRQADQGNEPKSAGHSGATYFRTHPYYRDRHQAILRQFAQLRKQHPKQELFVGRENLKLRMTRLQMEQQP